MSSQVTGRLTAIGKTMQIASKNGGGTFTKREFLLDATTHDPYTGERSQYENILPLEVSGDKCGELDQFKIGDVVTVSFALQGRSWTNQDGELKRMVSVRCYKIEARKSARQDQQMVSQPPMQPIPQHGTIPQWVPPEVDANGNPKDDLPF